MELYLHSSMCVHWKKFHCTPSPCFTPFLFNVPCQFTPLNNLRSLIFGSKPFGFLLSITLTPHFWRKYNFFIYALMIYAQFFSNATRVKQGCVFLPFNTFTQNKAPYNRLHHIIIQWVEIWEQFMFSEEINVNSIWLKGIGWNCRLGLLRKYRDTRKQSQRLKV